MEGFSLDTTVYTRQELAVWSETYETRELPEESRRFGRHMTDDYMITAVYDPCVNYRLVEEYGPRSFSVGEGGGDV